MQQHNTQPLAIPLRAYHTSSHQFILRLQSNAVNSVATKDTVLLVRLHSRPFHFMSLGQRTVLSSKELTQLSTENPHHPRVRRHIVACQASVVGHELVSSKMLVVV